MKTKIRFSILGTILYLLAFNFIFAQENISINKIDNKSTDQEIFSCITSKNRKSKIRALEVLTNKTLASKITNAEILIILSKLTTNQTDYQIRERAKVFWVINSKTPVVDKRKELKTYAQTDNYLLKKLALTNLGRIGTLQDIPFLESKLSDRDAGTEDVDVPPYVSVFEVAMATIDQIKTRQLPSDQQIAFLIKRIMEDPNNYARRQMMADFGGKIIPALTQKLVELFQRDFLQNNKQLIVDKDFPRSDPLSDVSLVLENMDISNSEGTKILIPYINHQQNLVKYNAICALKGIGTKEAITELEKIEKGENNSNYTIWYHAQEAISLIRARSE